MSTHLDRRKDDQLAVKLDRQTFLMSQMAAQLRKLSDVPERMATLSEKVSNLSTSNESMADLIVTSTRHKTILQIFGTALMVLFPMVVVWNQSLRVDIAKLQHEIIILKERQERFYVVPPTGTYHNAPEEYPVWHVWQTYRL